MLWPVLPLEVHFPHQVGLTNLVGLRTHLVGVTNLVGLRTNLVVAEPTFLGSVE